MKCTNRYFITAIVLSAMLMLTGCGELAYTMPYSADMNVSTYDVLGSQKSNRPLPFAYDLCVVDGDKVNDENVDMSQAYTALLFDVNEKEVLYSKNVHEQLHPASLTKIMTALVALKHGSLNQELTATNSVYITESGAQLCGLKSGDTMTLDQALHILLIYSANDVAMMIAENVAGSVQGFVDLMNEEAHALGATNTHFMNPHGLTQEDHYTTPYDLYLMFNEAIKYEKFNEIIHMTSYSTVFYDSRGREKDLSVKTTNLFLQGVYDAPSNITVIGGKTGTTNAAGHCLALLSRDTSGNPYISIIMRSQARVVLYEEMIDLLDEIHK